jgi:uncharacterized RDD family membrane protein YckC
MAGKVYHSDVPDLAGPWPRFWARLLDLQLYSIPVILVLALLFPEFVSSKWFEGPGGDFLLGGLCLPFAMAIDATILSMTGSSVGKGIAGIFLASTDGQRLPLERSLVRNAHLWLKGLVLGIPLLALIGYSNGYNDLQNSNSTSWDRDTDSRVYSSSNETWRTWVVAVLAIFLYSVGNTLSRMGDSGAY